MKVPLSLSYDCLTSLTLLNVHPHLIALGLASLLAAHGLRKGSLAPSGAATAFLIGYLTMANPLPVFGVLLIVFYLTGSQLTKIKSEVKAKLEREAGSKAAEHKSKKGGQRDGWQVVCNGLTGCLASVFFRILLSGELPRSCYVLAPITLTSLRNIMPLDPPMFTSSSTLCSLEPTLSHGYPRFALFVALGHFGCCAGDVFASELGILASKPPRLITTMKSVPPGTNGGLSLVGTAASALGGLWMGIVFVLSMMYWNAACPMDASEVGYLLSLATLAGFAGSMLDSLLGATLQQTWYHTRSKQVLVGSRDDITKKERKEWKIITGKDVLSNNQVNFISSAVTAIGIAALDQALLS